MRRILFQAALVTARGTPVLASAAAPVIEVCKSATCGCCTAWVDHLKANGYGRPAQPSL